MRRAMWSLLARLDPWRYTKANTSHSLSREMPMLSKQLWTVDSGGFPRPIDEFSSFWTWRPTLLIALATESICTKKISSRFVNIALDPAIRRLQRQETANFQRSTASCSQSHPESPVTGRNDLRPRCENNP